MKHMVIKENKLLYLYEWK